MVRKKIVVGIMPLKKMREYTMAIACGKHNPGPDEPNVWFESEKAMAQVLSGENKALLRMILERKPQSITELAQLSGREKGNLSRTLKKMESLGLVIKEKVGKRHIYQTVATDFVIHTSIFDADHPFYLDTAESSESQRTW
jgi:predicted transcriptional regulator